MAIEILTDASERHSWYEHPLTRELRNDIEEKIEEIMTAWMNGGYVIPTSVEASHSMNLAALSNYQILESMRSYMKELSIEEKEEEVDDETTY